MINEHSPICHDHDGCAADWHSVWWNIVGSGLLNGQNPLSYREAVQRLSLITEIGRMCHVCFDTAVTVAKTSFGWEHRYEFMETAAEEVESMIIEDKDYI